MAQAQQQSDHEHAEAYKLINTASDTELEFDEWQDAQDRLNDAVEEFPELQPDDFRIEPVTSTDGGTENQTEPEDEPDGEPVDKTEFDGRDTPDADPVDVVEHPQNGHASAGPRDLPQVTDGMQDPIETLPEWMKTEIQHGKDTAVDLNKTGCQVIANALEYVVDAECEISAKETDFEYSRYRATVETPDGNTYSAVGDCHIDESGKNKWDLERMAETRAKKRALKWSCGGGIQAFVEAGENDA